MFLHTCTMNYLIAFNVVLFFTLSVLFSQYYRHSVGNFFFFTFVLWIAFSRISLVYYLCRISVKINFITLAHPEWPKLKQSLGHFRASCTCIMVTVDVLIFRILVACQIGLDKQGRSRSDCFWRSSLIVVFPICYPDNHFVNSSPDSQHYI